MIDAEFGRFCRNARGRMVQNLPSRGPVSAGTAYRLPQNSIVRGLDGDSVEKGSKAPSPANSWIATLFELLKKVSGTSGLFTSAVCLRHLQRPGLLSSAKFFVRDELVMSRMPVRYVLPLLSALIFTASGCCHWRNGGDLISSQNHARDLYARNQMLLQSCEEANQMMMGLDHEKQGLLAQLNDAQSQIATANERISNLMAERGELTDRFAKSLSDSMSDGSGVSSALQADGFEYDPVTGLNKFRSDILFDLGSDLIRAEAVPTISEFASSVTAGAASGLKILVVGHTDDQNIVRPETAIKHPTNWHLSTDRSDAVILQLLKAGVDPKRIVSMGYSEFHPLELSQADTARQRNRRVELFVVPNDPAVARWDPVSSLR